ncbi:hypothetical protein fugu_019715 [Takifugu bimaculatus]|uniref:C2H2-type domain-containing protein n=1 Tax=Takifugu bimaculatus TaxID=433685 RepID=A0A4Z2BGF7_9TELE|nr:hypothetical protein fugu_019715 [Takifugu bimaculatus]
MAECKGSSLPPASLQLLVPPIRLLSSFIWQVVNKHIVMHYDKVADFISLATEIVPELLSIRERAQLVMNLRARLVLELCRGDAISNLPVIQKHLDYINVYGTKLNSTQHMAIDDALKTTCINFSALVQKLLNAPLDKEMFFQQVFPTIYDSEYDQSLQRLVLQFLSKLEQMLPIPDLQQTAAWLSETPLMSEVFGRHLSEPSALKTLLLHHRQMENISSAASSGSDDELWPALTLPGVTYAHINIYTECLSDANDNNEAVDGEHFEEDLTQSPTITENDPLLKKKKGQLSSSFICPQCSFTHCTSKRVQEHIQEAHHISVSVIKTNMFGKCKDAKKKKVTSKRKEKQDDTAKQNNLETRKGRQKRELSGVDRRFLITRPVNKNFTEKDTKCPKCEKVFELPNQLTTHMRLHSFPYSCIQCEKGFISLSGYYQHQRAHKRGRKFICSQCNKGFLCNYSLKQHQRLHEGPSNTCTICGKGLSKSGFVRHMQMHKGEKNYLCTVCGKSFLSSGELLLHTRSHTGEVPHTCTQCGKGFSTKGHLIVHMRSHTGERPYKCSKCPKQFLTLGCVKRHMLSHNGEKPFKCPSCDKEFSQQGNMKRHLATHSNDL